MRPTKVFTLAYIFMFIQNNLGKRHGGGAKKTAEIAFVFERQPFDQGRLLKKDINSVL
jgi:hypothetical protein